MTTRRTTHPHHAKPGGTTKRSTGRRASAPGTTSYVGGKKNVRGGTVSNVGGFSSTSAAAPRNARSSARIKNTTIPRTAKTAPPVATGGGQRSRPRGSANSSTDTGLRLPTPNGEILLTRRHFLFGALGVGALAAVGGGASTIIKQQEEANSVATLKVPTSAVTDSTSYTYLEDTSAHMGRVGSFELPYGTLLWSSGDDVAACLLPNDEAKPLVKVGLLSLASGNLPIVLEEAVGQADGFDIYDVRATTSGLVWTEANILDGMWRVYTARSDGSTIEEPRLVDEGDTNWEMPTIAAVDTRAFWQVMPKAEGLFKAEDSLVKRVVMGAEDVDTVYTSHGRPCTPLYALKDSLVITPRADTSGTYYQLTHLDATSGNILDTMVLPRSMRPLEAAYGDTGFMFSFDAIYNYGDGIANLGTYAPTSQVTDGNYSEASWFRFAQTPTAPPAWCGSYLMMKSKRTVCGINTKTNEYFAIQPDNGAEDYGEYLASTGSNDTVVTYANIDYKPVDGDEKKYCLVSIWAPLA